MSIIVALSTGMAAWIASQASEAGADPLDPPLCITGNADVGPSGSGACEAIPTATGGGQGTGLYHVNSVAVNPVGLGLYAASGDDRSTIGFYANYSYSGSLIYFDSSSCLTGSEAAAGPTETGCAAIPEATATGANSGLDGATALTVAPDGESLYAISPDDDSLIEIDLPNEDNQLSYQGCLTGETQSGDTGTEACEEIPSATSGGTNSGMDHPSALAVSPDGEYVYVASRDDDAVTVFSTDGGLAFESCITGETQSGDTGTEACAEAPDASSAGANSGLDSPAAIATDDADRVFVAAAGDDALTALEQGVSDLTFEGCATGEIQSGSSGTGACDAIASATSAGANSGLDSPSAIGVSGDYSSLYMTAADDDSIATFDPSTTTPDFDSCLTGETQSGDAGTEACAEIEDATSNGTDSGIDEPNSIAKTIETGDETYNLYVGSGPDDAISKFDRNNATGAIAYDGCTCTPESLAESGNGSGLDGLRSVVAENSGDGAVFAAAPGDASIVTYLRNTEGGELTFEQCISGDAEVTACTPLYDAPPQTTGATHSGLGQVSDIAISPDGTSIYAVSNTPASPIAQDGSLATFDRDPETGEFSYAGCITGDIRLGTEGDDVCDEIPSAADDAGADSGFQGLTSVAVSPDGLNVYVTAAADDAVVTFGRDEETGELTYAGCITGETQSGPGGSDACNEIPEASSNGANSGLDFPNSVVGSEDGLSVYVASRSDDAIATFDRDDETGELAYAGCITGETQSGSGGSDACDQVVGSASAGADSGLDEPSSIATTEDGESVYISSAGDDSIAQFDRDIEDGSLDYQGCISGEEESSDPCAAIPAAATGGSNSGLNDVRSIAMTHGGTSVYAASYGDDSIVRFGRDRDSGELSYLECISTDTSTTTPEGPCLELDGSTSTGEGSGLNGPVQIEIDASDSNVYVASPGDSAIAQFHRFDSGRLRFANCVSGDVGLGPVGTEACKVANDGTRGGRESGLSAPTAIAVDDERTALIAGSAGDSALSDLARHIAVDDSLDPSLEASGPLVDSNAPLLGAYPEIAVEATDAGSGIASVTFYVDDEPVDELSRDCRASGCSVSGFLIADLSEDDYGSHEFDIVAMDHSENETTISGDFTLDPDTPTLDVTGDLVEAAGHPLDDDPVEAEIDASDPNAGGSGVARIEVLVDDELAGFADTVCEPSCPSSTGSSFEYDPETWGEGPHELVIIALDRAGNRAERVFEIDVPEFLETECPTGTPTELDQGDYLTASEAAGEAISPAVAHTEPAVDPVSGAEFEPQLQYAEDPQDDLIASGTLGMVRIGAEAAPRLEVDGVICLSPGQTTDDESDPLIANDGAAVFANSATDVDTVIRPSAGGATVIESFRGEGIPENLAWNVGVPPGHVLDELSGGGVAVVDPAVEVSDASVPQRHEDAEDPESIPSVEVQLSEQQYQIAAAESELGYAVKAVISAPYYIDEAIDRQAATLSVSGDQIGVETDDDFRALAFDVIAARPANGIPDNVMSYYMLKPQEFEKHARTFTQNFYNNQSTDRRQLLIFLAGRVKHHVEKGTGVQINDQFWSNSEILDRVLKVSADAYHSKIVNDPRPVQVRIALGATNYKIAHPIGPENLFPDVNIPAARSMGADYGRTLKRLSCYIHHWSSCPEGTDIASWEDSGQGTWQERMQVAIAGDIEMMWGLPGQSKALVEGAAKVVPFYNIGTAGGCAATLSNCNCAADDKVGDCDSEEIWSKNDVGMVSDAWGVRSLPEIYYPSNLDQWLAVQRAWRNSHDDDDCALRFDGATTALPSTGWNPAFGPNAAWSNLKSRSICESIGSDVVTFWQDPNATDSGNFTPPTGW